MHLFTLALTACSFASPGPVPVETRAPLSPSCAVAIGPITTPGDEDSLFKITQPGSYRLTFNIHGATGKHGIEIETTGPVTIDLCGHALLGVAGTLSGIFSNGHVNLSNGSAQHWGETGIHVGEGTITLVNAHHNGGAGIRALWGSTIDRCRTEGNGAEGISVGDVSLIQNCVAKLNGSFGISVDGACTINANVLYNNQGGGIRAALAVITGNMLFNNIGDAIADDGLSRIESNHIHTSTNGILASGTGSTIQNNTVAACITGYNIVGTGNLVTANKASGNTTAFSIAPGNSAGALINAAGAGDLSLVPGAGHPHANLDL